MPDPTTAGGDSLAMRVSTIGWAFDDRQTVLEEAKKSAEVTHKHPEGIKGAYAMALAVYFARMGSSKEDAKSDIESIFGYDLSSRMVDDIGSTYKFEVSCQKSVSESILFRIGFLGECCSFSSQLRWHLGYAVLYCI